jgi:hypothetical protein
MANENNDGNALHHTIRRNKMLVFNSLVQLTPYYHEESNTYVFNYDVEFRFNVDVSAHIHAMNINAKDIKAWNINAFDIDAEDINAYNINAVDIKAGEIKAKGINARDIKALDINAGEINARNINAKNIDYYAVCFAYESITCNSIKGYRENHKHFVLDGEIIIKGD